METNTSEISIIFQGAVCEQLQEIISSIRKILPNAVLILSTWKDSNVQGLDCDEIILSEDPGFFYYTNRKGAKQNNVNRQIVSTLAGLKRVKTKYALKMRTDFSLSGSNFLEYLKQFKQVDKDYQIFQDKILACCYFTRNPSVTKGFPFHPSDLALFGGTDDLINLFDVPLMTKKEADWDKKNSRFNRYVPEQHIFINCLRKNGKVIQCEQYNDNCEHNIIETEKYFASNFIFLTFEQFNLVPLKNTFFMKMHPNAFRTCFTHNEWLALYKKHIDPTLVLPLKDNERIKIENFYRQYKKFRLLSNILALPFLGKDVKRKIRNSVLEFCLND